MATAITRTRPAKMVREKDVRKKSNFQLTVLALPAIIYFFLFAYLPMTGLLLAFKDYRFDSGIFGSSWAGLKNFVFFFSSQDAGIVTRNTIMLNSIFIVLVLGVSMSMAIILNEISRRMLLKTYQTIMIVPYFLSMTVVAYAVYAFLNIDLGIVNKFLVSFGMEPIMWYSQPKYWIFILSIVKVWKDVGYNTVVFYAAIMSFDKEYYESAAIDGAGRLKCILKITVPLLAPITTVLFILQMGKVFQADFGLFYMVPKNSSALYSVTDVIDTYVYRSMRVLDDMGIASATAFYQSVAGFILVLFTNWASKKIDSDNGLF